MASEQIDARTDLAAHDVPRPQRRAQRAPEPRPRGARVRVRRHRFSARSYIKANEEIVRRVVRSYVEAIHRFKTNKEIGLKVLQKYTRVQDPEILEATYVQHLDYIESIPYVS